MQMFGSPFIPGAECPRCVRRTALQSCGWLACSSCDQSRVDGTAALTSIVLLRLGEPKQGVGLHSNRPPGEQAPGLSVLHGHRQSSTASYLVTSDFSGAVLTEDALGILETVGSEIRGDAGDPAAVICDGAMD